MKDPDRIPILMDKLETLWKKYPELRLCQLLSIITNKEKYMFFFIEDKNVEDCVDKVLNKGRFDD